MNTSSSVLLVAQGIWRISLNMKSEISNWSAGSNECVLCEQDNKLTTRIEQALYGVGVVMDVLRCLLLNQ